MIHGNMTAQDLLRHLNLTEPLETGTVVGVQITKEQDKPMTVHVMRVLPYGRGVLAPPVLDAWRWLGNDWEKITKD